MLTEAEKKWLEKRKVGMCCRCVHYYTDITDCGIGCQWIANKDFPMLQCYRFRHEDYTIEKGNYEDAADFEARVAAYFAKGPCYQCKDKPGPNARYCIGAWDREGAEACRLKHARLAVEEEMEKEGK